MRHGRAALQLPPTSAIARISSSSRTSPHVRKAPNENQCTAAETALLDHHVGARQKRFRNVEADSPGSFEIDSEFKFRRLFHRQIAGFCAT